MGFVISLGLGTAIAMDVPVKINITPDTSTALFYLAAEKAHEQLRAQYNALPAAQFVEDGVTAGAAVARIGTAYRSNILELGFHSGIKEGSWKLRSPIKWGNQQLLRAISARYRDKYNPNPNVLLNDSNPGFDSVDTPFITFSAAYTPVVNTQDLMKSIQGLKVNYDANPAPAAPDCVVM